MSDETDTESSTDEDDLGHDHDGLTPAVLRERYEQNTEVSSWCRCGKCKIEHLVGALEYRCCFEVNEAQGKLVFDGSIEQISCITQHDDFIAMSNTTVLQNVGPLLRDRQGRKYRRKAGLHE
eukprot:gene9985-18608_t